MSPNKRVAQTLAAAWGASGLCERLANLWVCASPPRVGIGEQSISSLCAHFLAGLWAPLLNSLEEHKNEIRVRQARGYRKHDCFPLVGNQIVSLRNHVCHLTEVWYGANRGCNLSAFYRWFVEAMGVLGVTAYSYETIPQERTSDNWAMVVDGAARVAALKDKGNNDADYVAAGGLAQRQGRSAIDNTVLRNLLMPLEARELLVGRRFRKVICHFFAIRQMCILNTLSGHLQLDLVSLAAKDGTAKDHNAVRVVLQGIRRTDLAPLGIDRDSLCFRQLLRRGTVLAGFGQLDAQDQKAVWEAARKLLIPPCVTVSSGRPRADSADIFEQLVAWQRDRPGEFFNGDKDLHRQVKIAGVWSGRIVLVKRSAMERFALARYFPLYWERSQPLWSVMGTQQSVMRQKGAAESSHLRANECPYARYHGMSLSGGSHADDPLKHGSKRNSLLTEMQWVKDPSANLENWYLTDIEKILQEAWQLNPHGQRDMCLPGEMYVCVGQNPKVGSSIKETQHTQLCECSVMSYPVLQLTSDARFSQRLDAWVDLVDIGPASATVEVECGDDQLGVFLRLSTLRPTASALVEFLVLLRLELLNKFGGGNSLDFLVLALSDERAGFVVLFAPLPQLLKLDDAKPDFATWANPFTGESSESVGLEEARIDVGKGLGHFLVSKQALREQILADGEDIVRRIWAFNRIPGMRRTIEDFICKHNVFPTSAEGSAGSRGFGG